MGPRAPGRELKMTGRKPSDPTQEQSSGPHVVKLAPNAEDCLGHG